MLALAITAAILASDAALAMPDKDGGVPILFHTQPEGAEVLVVPKNLTSLHRPRQCTAPCVLRLFPDDTFEVFAVGPGQRGEATAPLHFVRMTNGRYAMSPAQVTFVMIANDTPR